MSETEPVTYRRKPKEVTAIRFSADNVEAVIQWLEQRGCGVRPTFVKNREGKYLTASLSVNVIGFERDVRIGDYVVFQGNSAIFDILHTYDFETLYEKV